jgi:glyoxylase-like metal-dependent hydrolase (beta-lactamase superfamily II)
MYHQSVLDNIVPPRDPRVFYDLPPLGGLASITRLDDLVTRIVAPNPSSMTLDGTNTYVVGNSGSGACIVIDPGPKSAIHFDRVESVLHTSDAEVAMVLVTHHHRDHAAAAQTWAEKWGCTVAANSPKVSGPGGLVFKSAGQTLRFGSLQVEVVPTPGHCMDHVAFRLENGVLFTGDHILGRGTSVLTWPDGDLVAYIESLQRILTFGSDALYPGHGPQLVGEAPEAVINYYLAHRAFRENQLISILGSGPMTLGDITELIYVGLQDDLKEGARQSTRACLDKLQRADKVREMSEGLWMIPEKDSQPSIVA